MRTRISLKLAVMHGKEKAKIKFDVCKLRSEEIRRRYYIKVKNGFEVPGDIIDPEEEDDKTLAKYRDAAEKVIGISKKHSKPWIGDKTWKKFKRGKR